MKTLTVKVSDAVDSKLKHIAEFRHETKSAVIRDAIEIIINSEKKIQTGSCRDLASKFAGCIKGPHDLGSNKKYLQGYGK